MEKPAQEIRQNSILAALPEPEYQRISAHLEPVHLSSGKIIYEVDQRIDYVYFPSRTMVSLVTLMEDGKIVEVGLVGRDGMTGIVALMGQKTSPDRAIVQIPDSAVRARVEVIKEEFARGGSLQSGLLRYAYTFMRQVSQTAACNAAHTAEERLSRWLLMCQDRVQSDELKADSGIYCGDAGHPSRDSERSGDKSAVGGLNSLQPGLASIGMAMVHRLNQE